MVDVARARLDREGLLGRLVAGLLIALLLVTSEAAVAPAQTQARRGVGAVASLRHRQMAVEDAMRRADRQVRRMVRRLSADRREFDRAGRRLDRAIARRDRRKRTMERTRERLVDARVMRDRTLRVRPSPSGRQVVDRPALRKQVDRLQRALDREERRGARADRRVRHLRVAKQRQARHASVGRLTRRKQARERAESRLSRDIVLMLTLASTRAERRFRRSTASGFRKPAKGQVSQGFGCTGVGLEPRRGRCRHYHDGIDIAAPRGAPVRASADGFVAYVGWNPWDADRRAFVVIIGHKGGFESIYGHLQPVRKVRAGQRVRRGQVIGAVGMTGRTTGPHLHWEVSRGFRALDPRRAGR